MYNRNTLNYDCIADTSDLNNVIDLIDVEDLGDHIYFGPQAEVMEKVTQFNNFWNANLEITKTFKWKRGSYKTVIELVNKYLGFTRKPGGMYNFLSREDYFRSHSWNSMRSELRRIDTILTNNRWSNEVWLDDPSILVERKSSYANYMCEKAESAWNLMENMDDMIELSYRLYCDPNSRSSQRYRLVTSILMSPDIVKIYIANSSGSAPKHVQDLPCNMDLEINMIMYPIRDITRNQNFDNPRFHVETKGNKFEWDDRGELRFPYLSQSYRDHLFGGNVCFGDGTTDISTAINKYDLTSVVLQLSNWASSYTNRTNPHSNIKTMYHGEPEKLSEEYRKVFGTNRADYCTYRPSGEDDYCDIQQCALRHVCNTYKAAYPEPVTPEQAEQMTLQWATRMGGVNHAAPTVIHTTDSQGNPISVTRDRTSMEQAADAQEPIDRNERWNPENLEPEEIERLITQTEREMEE